MSAPNAGKSLTCEFSNYILVLQKRSIGSCEIKQLHGILFQKRSLESLHFLPTPNGAEMSEEREVTLPSLTWKKKKKENPSNLELWKYKDRKHYRSACPEVGNKWVPFR